MKLLLKPILFVIFISAPVFLLSFLNHKNKTGISHPKINTASKIQVAILLDVSNSMDGLIDQAKAQLWNMVSVMGKAKCNDATPQIEIALYEYGRTDNDVKEGYVKLINAFTGDLDQLSQNLFKLKTHGGDEYCGHVIYTSINQLQWDNSSANNYKVIFIAGNEDFLQGDILYTKACTDAKNKGVVVNTIYCGERMQGIKEHWNLGAECGGGSFTNINQDAKFEDIPTPYDSTIYALNEKLNSTYISYGYNGKDFASAQEQVDKLNSGMSKSAGLKRIAVKGKASLYKNSKWDMVDASIADSLFFAKVDMKTLPDSLQKKSRKELQQVVKQKTTERSLIQKEIEINNTKRENYIAAEKTKAAVKNNTATLETEIEKIIKQQAKQYNIVIQ